MTQQTSDLVPRQSRRHCDDLTGVENEVARTADLVLKLTALADRYDGGDTTADRVRLLRETAARGCQALADLVEP